MRLRCGTDFLKHCEAIHPRQTDIEQHEIHVRVLQRPHRPGVIRGVEQLDVRFL